MTRQQLALAAFTLLAAAGIIWASEAEEIRQQAKAMQRMAAELAERGEEKEADQLRRHAAEMLEHAERLELERRHAERRNAEPHEGGRSHRHPAIEQLRDRLEALHQHERALAEEAEGGPQLDTLRSVIKHTEAELRHVSRELHRERAAPAELAERLEHMLVAVEHLNHAGLHDIAQHVAERAEATERELHGRRQGPDGEMMHEVMQQLEKLRREVDRLRAEVNAGGKNR